MLKDAPFPHQGQEDDSENYTNITKSGGYGERLDLGPGRCGLEGEPQDVGD
jgi:hypothetical protein